MTTRVLKNLMSISFSFWAARLGRRGPSPATAWACTPIGNRSHELADAVSEHGERDFLTVGLAPEERLRELRRLIQGDLGGKRRLERIDHALHDHRTGGRERLLDHAAAVRGVLDREARSAARPREEGKI